MKDSDTIQNVFDFCYSIHSMKKDVKDIKQGSKAPFAGHKWKYFHGMTIIESQP